MSVRMSFFRRLVVPPVNVYRRTPTVSESLPVGDKQTEEFAITRVS